MNITIFKQCYRIFTICLVLLLLTACNSNALNFAEGGWIGDKKGSNIGPISDFGSIIVNDILYEMSRANVLINGEVASFFLVPTLQRWNPYVTLRVTFQNDKVYITHLGLLYTRTFIVG